MSLTLVGLLALVAAVLWWWWRSAPPSTPAAPPPRRAPSAPLAPSAPSASPAHGAAPAHPPVTAPVTAPHTDPAPGTAWADLMATQIAPLPGQTTPGQDLPPDTPLPPPTRLPLHAAELLDPLLTEPLMAALRALPRPPPAVHHLMSPAFVQSATSAELAALVMGEPAVAARVIATANSPMYGLQQPVTSVGQATTFLGLASVRQMCLQHLLAECFQPRDAAQRAEFDRLWQASSMAGELLQQLAPRLRIAEPGQLATLLVLSFLGRQAGAALLPDASVLPHMDAFERAVHEQQELGLASHELGHLLMRAWELPADLVDEARTLSALRFDPDRVLPADREAALTLGALCALLGERMARNEVGAALFDPAHDATPDMAALRPRLARPPLDQLTQELRSPPLVRLLSRLMPTHG
ncbi:HDOD domain-containing protein [Roseateles sp. BYS87W]|uniref:HDOD domain-containing protein n=1 Tax=Pelomonas baiyunensis TaxID=3299026 RepID=A0ABW7GZX5_9BURK